MSKNQLTFLDDITNNLGGKRAADFFTDSACMGSERKKALENKGIFCEIIQRRVRGQNELMPEQDANPI